MFEKKSSVKIKNQKYPNHQSNPFNLNNNFKSNANCFVFNQFKNKK